MSAVPTDEMLFGSRPEEKKPKYPPQTARADCPICHTSRRTNELGNHLRQKHKVPVPARQRNVAAWAKRWVERERKGKLEQAESKTIPQAPAPRILPSAEQVTVALVKNLWDGGDIPVRHLGSVLRLQAEVARFIKEVS